MKQEHSRRGNKIDTKRAASVSRSTHSPTNSPAKTPTVDMKQEHPQRGNKNESKRGNKIDSKRDSAHSPAKTTTCRECANPNLPCRLLPPGGLPDRARLNIYSKPEYLGILVPLLEGSEAWESQKRFLTWKKLSLALIVLVDGVVVCSNKKASRVTSSFVEMLHDIEFFMNYPWGRVSFEATIGRFGPSLLEKDPISELKTRLSQRSSCCYGFPLAIQLQVLNSIHVLCSRIKDPTDFRNFIQRPIVDLSSTILLCEPDVVDAEYNPNVIVSGYTLYHSEPLNEDLSRPDEVVDPRVKLIISLINQKHLFKPNIWHVHDIPCPSAVSEGKKSAVPSKAPSAQGQEFVGAPLDSQGTKFVDLHFDSMEEHGISEPKRTAKGSNNESYPLSRKPFTRSAKIVEEVVDPLPSPNKPASKKTKKKAQSSAAAPPVPHASPKKKVKKIPTHVDASQAGVGSSSSEFVTHSELCDLKAWISQQFGDLRSNINDDILQLLGNKFQHSKPRYPHNNTSKSHAMKKKEKLVSQKRKREEVTSLSSGSSSSGLKHGLSGDIPIDIPASPIPNSYAEECAADVTTKCPLFGSNGYFETSMPQKETGEEQIFTESPKQTTTTQITPFAQVIPDSHEASAGVDCKYCNLSSIVAASPAYFVHETTNIRIYLHPSPQLDDGEFQKFKELLEDSQDRFFTICTGHKLTNGHFLDIATKDKWVTTELITGMLMRHRAKAYSLKRGAIIDTSFASLVSTHYEDFLKCEDKENYEWDSSIKAYVTGKVTGIHMKSEFLKHVDVVYVSKNWGCSHYVFSDIIPDRCKKAPLFYIKIESKPPFMEKSIISNLTCIPPRVL
ncbi:hypothetical protein ISN45_Aa06g027760 [Arabidopsis thaliana x Arabidopsis arenosa]|uniref:DUF1985 domain-containing protein n=1 Tax=Arabidopsis thaliana x Arabidopsis arenosa TaxID=1240361 RepID=A0A8T1Z087_9BRAS|nr:hypothetical protein ISN45_Aa06g027760 [Arabidopsis thaliana x Arabidopsis arenosa]